MGATSTTVTARGRSRGARQRGAAGSLPCFCPALCLTQAVGSGVAYVAFFEAVDRQDGVTARVTRKVTAIFEGPVTLAHPLQDYGGELLMGLIEREKKAELVPLRIKLEKEHHDRLVRYSEFLESSPDHVVAQALDFVIRKDKEFAAILENAKAGASKPPLAKRSQAKAEE